MTVGNRADLVSEFEAALGQRLACLADAGEPSISERLCAIEQEWSAGRASRVVGGIAVLTGLSLGTLVSPWWLLLPAVAGLGLLQNIFVRTSWLAALFHRFGFRTGTEIDLERFALKALRGDFRHLPTVNEVENKDDIERLEGEGGLVLEPEESKPDLREAVRDVIHAAKC